MAARLKVGRGLGGWELARLNWSKLFKRGLLLKKSIIALLPEKAASSPCTAAKNQTRVSTPLTPNPFVLSLRLFANTPYCWKGKEKVKITWKLIARCAFADITNCSEMKNQKRGFEKIYFSSFRSYLFHYLKIHFIKYNYFDSWIILEH